MYPFTDKRVWRPEDKNAYVPRTLLLKCKCGQRFWSQKNLGYIGARSIHHFAGGCEWMRAQFDNKSECDCPIRDLEVDVELMQHVVTCEECKAYGY